MSWTTPKTWGSEILTSSDMNTYVRDDLLYLYGIAQGVTFSGVDLSRAASTNISDSTTTPITWTAETFDYGGWWSSGTDITVPAGAVPTGYTTIALLVFGRTKFASNGTGSRAIQLLVNGSELMAASISALSGEVTEVLLSNFIIVEAGDIITMNLYQTSGTTVAATSTAIRIARLAPVA